MSTRSRFALAGLAACLDFGPGVSVTGATVDGSDVVLALSGVEVDGQAPDEAVAEYLVGSDGRRSFLRFKLPDSGTAPVADSPDKTEVDG